MHLATAKVAAVAKEASNARHIAEAGDRAVSCFFAADASAWYALPAADEQHGDEDSVLEHARKVYKAYGVPEGEVRNIWAELKARHRAELRRMGDNFSQLMRLKQECDAKYLHYKVQVKEVEAVQAKQYLEILDLRESLTATTQASERQRASNSTQIERLKEQVAEAKDALKAAQNEHEMLLSEASRLRISLEKELDAQRSLAEQAGRDQSSTHATLQDVRLELAAREAEVLNLRETADEMGRQVMQLKSDARHQFEVSARACACQKERWSSSPGPNPIVLDFAPSHASGIRGGLDA